MKLHHLYISIQKPDYSRLKKKQCRRSQERSLSDLPSEQAAARNVTFLCQNNPSNPYIA